MPTTALATSKLLLDVILLRRSIMVRFTEVVVRKDDTIMLKPFLNIKS